eukprot:g3399.t1
MNASTTQTLLLTVALAFSHVAYVTGSHGDNMLCEGCGAVMEHVYHDVLKYAEERGKSIDMTQGETVTVDFTDRVKKICHQKEFVSEYNRNVRSACWEMCHKFPNVLSNVFGGDEPNERTIYPKTYKACVEILDYCDKIDESYVGKLIRSPSSTKSGDGASHSDMKCNRCRTVVSDIVHVVNRKSSWDFFRTKEHIYSVLDSICNGIVYRYPESLTNVLSEMCSDIIENYEHEIAQVLIDNIDQANDLICGKKISNFCSTPKDMKETKGNTEGRVHVPIWESPFHRVPLADLMGKFDPFEEENMEQDEAKEETDVENKNEDDIIEL